MQCFSLRRYKILRLESRHPTPTQILYHFYIVLIIGILRKLLLIAKTTAAVLHFYYFIIYFIWNKCRVMAFL